MSKMEAGPAVMAKVNQKANDIFQKACLVQLSVRVWPGAKKIPKQKAIEALGSDWARAMKDIVDKKTLKPMEDIRTAAHRFLAAYTVPFPIRGIELVSFDALEILDAKFKELSEEMDENVDFFASFYPQHQQEAEIILGPELYRESDYPKNIKEKFGVEWRFFQISAPTENNLISPELVRSEQQKFINTMAQARETAVLALRTEIKSMVDKCIERLTPNADGTRKVFHKTTVSENFLDFFETFKIRNIFKDDALSKIVDQAKLIVEGVDVENLRTDEKFQTEVVKDMQKVAAQLDALIGDAPTRKLKI